jgi:hypothetical protein
VILDSAKVGHLFDIKWTEKKNIKNFSSVWGGGHNTFLSCNFIFALSKLVRFCLQDNPALVL